MPLYLLSRALLYTVRPKFVQKSQESSPNDPMQ